MVYVVLGAIALALFGLSLLAQAMAARRADNARHWASVAGRIASSGVRQNGNGTYMPEVSYSYVVAGQGYASDRLRPGGTPFFYSQARALAIAAAYQPGDAVTVRYDPGRPNRPAIELAPMSYWILPLRLLAAVIVVVTIAVAVTKR